MDLFHQKVRTRIRVLTALAVGVALIYAGFMLYRSELPILNSFTKGFHQGIFFGLELVILGFLAQNIKGSRNDAALKKMRIEENDERFGLIIQKTASMTALVMFAALGVATVIAGFLNAAVFFSLLGALLFMVVLFYSMWIYFAKRN
ncbi:hypothetical protein QWJ34_00735 [Saccharibacillus sp. CPCC 101409]|uniref:hypothetical protein n=1 Tax=Saccharibacillus sp. CPCC 101409 TaxID=3058041 RepID=UPI002673DD39|nr:hypothetical protein [Saccharibacillus sp. CPCC 101409]MDO3408284.1 hypothetical protein [Saccharibacillus sp. CPCC 101409]